jgi:integrase
MRRFMIPRIVVPMWCLIILAGQKAMPVHRITNTIVEQMPSGKRDVFIWDADLKGFGAKITPAGKRVYLIKYRMPGSQRTRKLKVGDHGTFMAPRARATAKELLAQVRLGVDPSKSRAASRETFADVMGVFVDQHVEAKLKPRTGKGYMCVINKYILPKFKKLKISDVTKADVSTLHHSMKRTPTHANFTISVLSTFFRWCEDLERMPIGSNPCRHIKKYKLNKRTRFLNVEELALLGGAIPRCVDDGTIDAYFAACIQLLIFTGARSGEIMSMKWDYIDFPRAIAKLPDSKTGEKILHLSPPAIDVLNSIHRLHGNPYVICGANTGDHLKTTFQAWRRLTSAAGIHGVRVHDLRHTFASHAVIGGASLQVVGSLLGHTQTRTTERYAHLSSDPIRRAGDSVGQSIEAAMNGGGDVINIASTKGKRNII